MTCIRLRPFDLIRPLLTRLWLSVVLVALVAATVGASAARADPAPQPWLPTAPDLVRTLRPCRVAVEAPTPPVCWSVAEDTTAWMAQPAGSPDPWGQCTYYAGLVRPDIWNDRAPPADDPLSDDWDAWTWVEHAQAEGLAVDGNPRPGDVMVYSQASVGNQTGHVAIVDAVGPDTDPAANVELTISEMNVDGLDNASLGQGDTMVLLVPRSQLVPGMIQFIHRPGPGYAAPAWPTGADRGYVATAASAPAASGDPSLTVGLAGAQLETVSESTSPVLATVTSLPGGAAVKQISVAANRITALSLPGGMYRVCVSQAADGTWPAVSSCATGGWQVPPRTVKVRFGPARIRGRGVALPVVLSSSGPVPVSGVTAVASLVQRRRVRSGRRWVMRTVTLKRASVRLRSGRQVLGLAVARGVVARDHAVLRLSIPAQTSSGYRIDATQASASLR